jgi:NAD(P)H-hydrate epimerase
MELEKELYTGSQIRNIEKRYCDENGLCCDLMHRAGLALAECVEKKAGDKNAGILVFCGPGNNGGDGYETASVLLGRGYRRIRCVQFKQPRAGTEAAWALQTYLAGGGIILTQLSDDIADDCDILVDALLGIGTSGEIRQPMLDWIGFINRHSHGRFVISADVPSGLDGDTGACFSDAVRSDLTLMLLRRKAGLYTGVACDYIGRLEFNDLGVKERCSGESLIRCLSYDDPSVAEELPRRRASSNKNDSGRLALIGGAPSMPGALKMSAMAALRSGAGLVRVAASPESIPLIFAGTPEVMLWPLDDAGLADVQKLLQWAHAVVLGPGLGRDERAARIFEACIDTDRPKVVDADGLYWLSKNCRKLINAVITPHEMEAARLLQTDIESVRQNRYNTAVRLYERFGAVVVLKGYGTVIYDGESTLVSAEGNAAMAVGGMGDLLAGIIGSFLAQGMNCSQAARIGVSVHGRAGVQASADGFIGTLPTDLLPGIRQLVNV